MNHLSDTKQFWLKVKFYNYIKRFNSIIYWKLTFSRLFVKYSLILIIILTVDICICKDYSTIVKLSSYFALIDQLSGSFNCDCGIQLILQNIFYQNQLMANKLTNQWQTLIADQYLKNFTQIEIANNIWQLITETLPYLNLWQYVLGVFWTISYIFSSFFEFCLGDNKHYFPYLCLKNKTVEYFFSNMWQLYTITTKNIYTQEHFLEIINYISTFKTHAIDCLNQYALINQSITYTLNGTHLSEEYVVYLDFEFKNIRIIWFLILLALFFQLVSVLFIMPTGKNLTIISYLLHLFLYTVVPFTLVIVWPFFGLSVESFGLVTVAYMWTTLLFNDVKNLVGYHLSTIQTSWLCFLSVMFVISYLL